MMVSGTKVQILEMVKANKFGLTDHSTKATGKTIKPTEEEDLFMQMEMCMKANGKKTKLMVLEDICILTVLTTKECGKKISNTEREKRPGLMAPAMKASTLTERKTELVNSNGLMVQPTMDSL
jgi:hypothetical protein